ncbi:hypothetical protein ACFX15_023950 [Malus domestica]
MVDGIYMEFLGGSFTGYAYHMTAVHPDSIYFNHQSLSVQESGVSREDVNYINAYATSTPTGDLKEYCTLIRCLGKNPELRVNSTKSMIDHLLGASGAVEATGCIHPNINLENPNESVQYMNVFVGPNKEKLDMKVVSLSHLVKKSIIPYNFTRYWPKSTNVKVDVCFRLLYHFY